VRGEVAQTMYTHVSKYKNDKIKGEKKKYKSDRQRGGLLPLLINVF
jgi:NADH:ubiquinone oxidoreductase subunit E